MNRRFNRTTSAAFLSMMATSALFVVLGCQDTPPAPDAAATSAPAPASAPKKTQTPHNMQPEDQRKDAHPQLVQSA